MINQKQDDHSGLVGKSDFLLFQELLINYLLEDVCYHDWLKYISFSLRNGKKTTIIQLPVGRPLSKTAFRF